MWTTAEQGAVTAQNHPEKHLKGYSEVAAVHGVKWGACTPAEQDGTPGGDSAWEGLCVWMKQGLLGLAAFP